jgi:hypothetical protein
MTAVSRPLRLITMRKNIFLLILAAGLSGCASFNSGDMLVERETALAMLEDKALTPFSAIEVSWQNFPYRAATDSIGEGSITNPKKIKPVPVDAEEADKFARKAREIYAKAGLYDRARGRGTLRLELTTFGRWTYSDLWRSFLVDTGFIFILPASLRVNYYLTAEFSAAPGPVRVETEARNKTTFHLLMAPLYPFLSPGSREKGLLKQMLWRSATDVYSRLKSAGPAADLPPKAEPRDEKAPLGGPPVQPDRTWLPGQTAEDAPTGSEPVPVPAKPDQTWVVGQPAAPAVQAPAPQTAAPVTAPAQPAQPAPQEPPSADETPDD